MTTSNIAGAVEKLREQALTLKKQIEDIQKRLNTSKALVAVANDSIREDEQILKKMESIGGDTSFAGSIINDFRAGITLKRKMRELGEVKIKENEKDLKTALESFKKLEEEVRFAQAKKIN